MSGPAPGVICFDTLVPPSSTSKSTIKRAEQLANHSPVVSKHGANSVSNSKTSHTNSTRRYSETTLSSSKNNASTSAIATGRTSTTAVPVSRRYSENTSSKSLLSSASVNSHTNNLSSSSTDIESDDPSSVYPVYTLEQLRINAISHIDMTHKEMYLSNKEFLRIFGMNKTQFQQLPKWKKDSKKKEKGLF